MNDMSESVAIVTGASSGIGKATALRLARDFGAIVLAARSGEKLGDVGQQVKTIGAESLALELDLMVPAAAKTVVDRTLDRFGRIDAVLNIAGAVAGVAEAMAFAVSPAARWMTGTVLRMDGGEVPSI
jgi:3-oxoacyl-[acyl-carrier protein] reductase